MTIKMLLTRATLALLLAQRHPALHLSQKRTAVRLVKLSIDFHTEWRGLRASLMELIFSDAEARKFFRKQRRRQLDFISELRHRFALPPRTRAQDALHLFTIERVFDAFGQGEILALGLDPDVVAESIVPAEVTVVAVLARRR